MLTGFRLATGDAVIFLQDLLSIGACLFGPLLSQLLADGIQLGAELFADRLDGHAFFYQRSPAFAVHVSGQIPHFIFHLSGDFKYRILDAWNKLPKDIQKTVLEIAAQMEDEMWNLAGDMDRKSRATLTEKGMAIKPVSKEFRTQLDAIGKQLRAEWAKKAGADAQAILKEYDRITGR